ncbi:MAG: sulfite exporter TauE/SafE family protein [Candidatus Rokuibacteriota bacterium]
MTAALAATLAALGVAGAFVAGLLGVGGAIVMIPLLLYVPPLVGVGALDVKAVSAITMAQVFVASLAGMLAHRRHQAVNAELAWVGGAAMGAASFVGAMASKWMHDRWLLIVLALMATGAALLMLAPVEALEPAPDAAPRRFSRARIVAVTVGVGLAAGLVGAGGAFLLVPLLLVVVGVPIRTAIGSSLAIMALASTAGLAGKVLTGQLPVWATLAVVLGVVPGARLGAAVSRRLRPGQLRLVLAVVVLATALRVWWDVFTR